VLLGNRKSESNGINRTPKDVYKKAEHFIDFGRKGSGVADALRRDTPRGHYIARMLRPSEEYSKRTWNLRQLQTII